MSREARQRVALRAGARIGVIAAPLAAAAALVLPTTALAATTQIGSTSLTGIPLACTAGSDLVQSMSAGASYAVPSSGTSITSWSIQAGAADTGSAALEVWTPTATPNLYQLAGISALEPLTAGTVNTFDLAGSPIPVVAGDLLGLHVEGLVTCASYTSDSANLVAYAGGPTPVVNGTEVLDQPGQDLALNVSAIVAAGTPPNPVPATANQCKGGGWLKLTDTAGTPFKNQGDCVSFVATAGTNAAAGS
jgi:hypothetical protein